MNISSVYSGFKNVISIFTGPTGVYHGHGDYKHYQPTPKGIYWARWSTRFLLLLGTLFIFVWWPVNEYTPSGFDEWSVRMGQLPDEVWVVLLGVILSWGVAEAAGRRGFSGGGYSGYSSGYSTYGGGGGYNSYGGGDPMMGNSMMNDPMMGDMTPPLDGRFSNLNNDDPEITNNPAPNPVIEEWRRGASE